MLFWGYGGTINLTAEAFSQAVTIGGEFLVKFAVGYSMVTNPTAPSTESVAGTLVNDPIVPTTVVTNAFDPNLEATYNHKTSVEIADSLGDIHVLDLYFVNENEDEYTWTIYTQIDNKNTGDPNPALPIPQNTLPTLSQYSVLFNVDGSLDEESSETIVATN